MNVAAVGDSRPQLAPDNGQRRGSAGAPVPSIYRFDFVQRNPVIESTSRPAFVVTVHRIGSVFNPTFAENHVTRIELRYTLTFLDKKKKNRHDGVRSFRESLWSSVRSQTATTDETLDPIGLISDEKIVRAF